MKKLSRFATAMLLSMFLFACGQSGPLYVSGNPSTVEPPASENETENEDEQDADSSASE